MELKNKICVKKKFLYIEACTINPVDAVVRGIAFDEKSQKSDH